MSKNHKGFTIIEVMIVLAIAGLILVIVFLAVPALQRNSRNNQYKNQAARILAATDEFYANNARMPKCSSYPCKNRGPKKGADIEALVDMANITQEDIQLVMWMPPGGTSFLGTTTDYLNIAVGVTCGDIGMGGAGGAQPGVNPIPASRHSVMVAYALENGDGSLDVKCIST